MTRTKRELSALHELATLCGLQTSYLAADETVRDADPEVLIELLGALGETVEQPRDARRLIEQRQLRTAQRALDAITVVRDEGPLSFELWLAERTEPFQVRATLRFEDGTTVEAALPAKVTMVASFVTAGATYFRYAVAFRRGPLASVRSGYHVLSLDVVDDSKAFSATSLVISAPRCPTPTRGWGFFMPQHALRSETDWGVGTYSDLEQLSEWTASRGGDFLGGLPLYPTFLDAPIDPSPYRPVSRLAYSELFTDPSAAPELTASTDAQALLASGQFRARLAAVRASKLVDYEEVARLHREILTPLAETLFASESPRRSEFEQFMSEHPELAQYAQYRGTVDRVGRDHVVREASLPAPDLADPSTRYHAYGQWLAHQQLSAAVEHVALYADLPVGSHPEGFDPYWSPRSFVKDLNCGAPPDLFFSDGQDWGFPPPSPEGIREDGYAYLRAMLARALRHASVLRIDHVMGLERLYVMPHDGGAQRGAYLGYRPGELHAVVSLEAQRHQVVIVGEDLGTVPDGLRERMAEDGMLRSWVFEFETTAAEPLPEPPPGVLASLATHDMARFSAFLWGRDVDEAESLGHFDEDDASSRRDERRLLRESIFDALKVPDVSDDERTDAARRGILEHLAASEALLVQVDLEELWGEREPQNRPGTSEGNWVQRAKLSLDEARGDGALVATLAHINDLRKADRR